MQQRETMSPTPASLAKSHLREFDPRYLVTLDELYHPAWTARKKYRISLLREAVKYFWPNGHPTRLIHLTGTNGKGSVAHYLCQGLGFAGPTGSWTSPHVFDYAERIHLSGQTASHKAIADVYIELLDPYQRTLAERTGGEGLSFAELGVLLALHLFERHGAIWGMIEVGAGGRYTPQMALDVNACVLTNVGHDHPRSLGQQLWQRAMEKAGIGRPEIPFFTAAEGIAQDYVVKTARAAGATCYLLSASDCETVRQALPHAVAPHRLRNLALTNKVIRHFYSGRKLSETLPSIRIDLPARFWRVADNIIADVAHNTDKVTALAHQLRLHFPNRRCHFLLGLTRQRDAAAVFAPLRDLAASVTLTGASYAGRTPRELYTQLTPLFPKLAIIADPRAAYESLQHSLEPDELLVLTGSAYMIDQALNPNPYLKYLNSSFGWRGQQSTKPLPRKGSTCLPSPSSF